ncbi:MAG: hypothetical protein V2A34_13535, partial [Lentisphaerota bacterium]
DFTHWKSNLGPSSYSMTMGSFFVAMNDTRGNEMYAWFTNEYERSFGNTNIKYRLLGQHYHNNADGRNPYFYTPPAGGYPGLMLVGHNHSFSTLQTSPYTILSSGAAHNYGAVALFAFNKSGTNWLCSGLSSHPSGTRLYAVGDWGAPKVSCGYGVPNDGSATTNYAGITNSLAFDFRDGRLRFLMRHVPGGYVVTGGVELAEYDYADGSNTAVLVQVNIRSNRLTAVSISRADRDEDGMPDSWEMAQFSNLTTATTSSDYDGDSQRDVEEYISGTQPTLSSSFFRVVAGAPVVEGLVLRWASLSNRCYTVFKSTNLLSGLDWNSLPTNAPWLPATPWENAYTDACPGLGQVFYRIGVMEQAE